MKYLLILLSLFSIHSFSAGLDGKGITCYKIEANNLKKYSAYYFKKKNKVKVYNLKKIKDEIKVKYSNNLKYTNGIDFITIFTNYSFYKIDKKTLEVVSGKKNQCKLHSSLLEVFKQMKIYANQEKEKLVKNNTTK